MVRNLLKAAGNDETYRSDNSRHVAASWLAHSVRGSPKARESLIAEAALAGSMAALVLGASVPQCHGISVKAVACRINSVDRARYSCVTLNKGSGSCGELSTGSSRQLVELTNCPSWMAAESTSSRPRTARHAAFNPQASGVECRVASGHDEGTDGVNSIGDEDKEQFHWR